MTENPREELSDSIWYQEVVTHNKPLKKFDTYNQLIDYGLELEEPEFLHFIRYIRNLSPYMLQNIGYWAGHCDRLKQLEIYQKFGTAHPIFGTHEPTAEEAFELGMKLGKSEK